MFSKSSKPVLISIVGPTAVGKTELSIDIAKIFNSEILSVDSRQLFKEMNIGTAKPTSQHLSQIKHHFINSHSITTPYSAGKFAEDALKLLNKLFKKNNIVLAVGGSGLYFKALWEGFDDIPRSNPSIREQLNKLFQKEGMDCLLQELEICDPIYYAKIDRQNVQRIIRALEVCRATGKPFSSFHKSSVMDRPYHILKIGLEIDRELLFTRINKRIDDMISQGLFEEGKKLHYYQSFNALNTVGYSEIFGFLEGEYDKEETIRLLKRNSRRYAKKQLTWFKKYHDIKWFDPANQNTIVAFIYQRMQELNKKSVV